MKTYSWLNQNRLPSHLRTNFCALLAIGTLLTLPSAEASPPEPASGEFFPCFTYAGPPHQAGGNTVITFNVTTRATGTLNGSLVGTELDVVHRDGSINLHGTAVFTGTINGSLEGTLLFTYNGIGNANTGHETLHFVGRQGTGGLAGVHFEGTADGDLGGECDGDFGGHGTYAGNVIFAR